MFGEGVEIERNFAAAELEQMLDPRARRAAQCIDLDLFLFADTHKQRSPFPVPQQHVPKSCAVKFLAGNAGGKRAPLDEKRDQIRAAVHRRAHFDFEGWHGQLKWRGPGLSRELLCRPGFAGGAAKW
jgi:hypothetical protein